MSEPSTEPQEPDEEQQGPSQDDDNEEGEGGDAEPSEPATEPQEQPQAHSLSPEQLEKRALEAERSFGRHAKRIGDLYEEEGARLLPCPLCPDQHKGFVHADFAGRVPQEIADAVKFYLGIQREQDYPRSQVHQACKQCEGTGKVATGSRVSGHEAITCPDCKGYGYMPPPAPTQKLNGAPIQEVSAEAITEALQSAEDVDEWGEPRILPDGRENPNFGKMPNRKVLVHPWGVTAHLTALDAAK